MADKYVNAVGVQTIKTWIEGKFALGSDLTTLSDRVDDIVAEGGEPNVIEKVQVNGTDLTITNKTVNVDLTNASYVATTSANGTMSSADKTKLDTVEADAQENVIETVKVNGTALVPDAQKAVDIEVPMVQATATAVQINDGAETQGIRFVETTNGYTIEGLGDTAPGEKELVDKTYVDSNKAGLTKSSNPAGATGEETTYTISQGSDRVSFNYTEDSRELSDYVNVNLGDDLFQVATTNYVDANGGKIDTIKLNNVTQTITNKTVDLEVLALDWEEDRTKIMKKGGLSSAVEFIDKTEGAELMFGKGSASSQTMVYKTLVDKTYVDNTFRTEAQVQSAIDASLADITGIDFKVVTELPATGVKGTIYLLEDGAHAGTYVEYIWIDGDPTGSFEKIGTTEADLTNYWTSVTGKTNTLEAMTVAEITAILEPTNP